MFFPKLLQPSEKKGLANATKGLFKEIHKIHDILRQKNQDVPRFRQCVLEGR